MIKEFKHKAKVVARYSFTDSFHHNPITVDVGSLGEVVVLDDKVLFYPDIGSTGTCIYLKDRADFTGLLDLVPQESTTQRKARELREQADLLVKKAKELEEEVRT